MSQSLYVVGVHLWTVQMLIGCKMDDIYNAHRRGLEKRLEEVDELIEDYGEDFVAFDPVLVAALRETESEPDPVLVALDTQFQVLKARVLSGQSSDTEFDDFMDEAAAALHEPKSEVEDNSERIEVIEDATPLPTAAELLRHLFFAEPRDERVTYAHEAIIEAMIKSMGRKITATNWLELKHAADWFEKLDQQLLDRGIDSSVLSINKHLVERGNPILKTNPGNVGYLMLDEVEAALAAMNRLTLRDQGPESHDRFLLDVRKWLKTCANEGEDLVCFM